MKTLLQACCLVLFASAMLGCGAPEVDEEGSAEMETLEQSPDYKDQMMGGASTTESN